MRIVLVNKFWYERGGAEKVVLITKKLLENAGHEVQIFGMKHPKNLFENKYFVDFVDYDHLNIWQKIKFGARAICNKQAKANLGKLLDDFKPDVVHFHNIYHQLSYSVIEAAVERKIKTVMTLHDYKFISPNYNLFHHGQIHEECVGDKYYNCLFSNCMENVNESLVATLEAYFVKGKGYKEMIDKFISPSNFLINKFVKNGFQDSSLFYLPNPCPETEFKLNNQMGDYVAYVGRLSEEKGLEFLLAAAEVLKDIKFKIIGEGRLRSKLEKIVLEKKLINVEFTGRKFGDELNNLLDRARLFVLPSVWYENAPLGVIEAKARGKIIIASDIGGISELLPAELLVCPGDVQMLTEKIKEWYYADFSKLDSLGKKLHLEAKNNNSGEVYLENLLKIYLEDK